MTWFNLSYKFFGLFWTILRIYGTGSSGQGYCDRSNKAW